MHQFDHGGSGDLSAAVETDFGDLPDSGLADLALLIGPDLQPLALLANGLPLADNIKRHLIVSAGEKHSDPLLRLALRLSFLVWIFLCVHLTQKVDLVRQAYPGY